MTPGQTLLSIHADRSAPLWIYDGSPPKSAGPEEERAAAVTAMNSALSDVENMLITRGRATWSHRWRFIVATVTACAVLGGSVSSPAWAESDTDISPDERADVVELLDTVGPVMRDAARAALLGSAEDLHRFIEQEWQQAQDHDDRIRAGLLINAASPTVSEAANAALDGSAEDVRRFLVSGFDQAWLHDERVRVGEAINTGGPTVTEAGNAALDAGDAAPLPQGWAVQGGVA